MAALSLFVGEAHSLVREGIYLGAGAGAAFVEFPFTASNTITGFSVSRNPDKTSCLGTAFLGYGLTTNNCLYIGFEVGTRFPSVEASLDRPGVTFNSFTFTNRLTVQEYVTADLLPGFRLSPDWLFYGRFGVAYSHMSLVLDENRAASVQRYEFTQNRPAFRIGAGLNWGITSCIGIALDYCYSDYRRQRTFIEVFSAEQSHKPRAHFAGLSLLYSFN